MGSLSFLEPRIQGYLAEGGTKWACTRGIKAGEKVPPLWELPHEAESKGLKYPGFSLPPALHLHSVPPVGQMQVEHSGEVQSAGVHTPPPI